MLPVKLDSNHELKVLCLGAHCDDIEIGCGGTLLRLAEEYSSIKIKWVVFTSTPQRESEARRSAEQFLQRVSRKEIDVKDFDDCVLPFQGERVKLLFERMKDFQPDIIFTHCLHDRHQDHRFICELTWNTFRNHLIFEYEIPKYEGDLEQPNFFVVLDPELAKRKSEMIVNYFPSQNNKQWFDQETFLALMRLRGIECASTTKYAEAFYVKKLVWQ